MNKKEKAAKKKRQDVLQIRDNNKRRVVRKIAIGTKIALVTIPTLLAFGCANKGPI